MKRRGWLTLAAILIGMVTVGGQVYTPLTNIMNLATKTDSNGSLMTYARTYATPVTPLTAFANLRGRTDANGSLTVTVAGGTVTPDIICLDSTNQDTCLVRDGAAYTLAQKNGVNAQVFRIYGTTTGPKYLQLTHDGSNSYIYNSASSGSLNIGAASGTLWTYTSAQFAPLVDNSYDLGIATGGRVRTGYYGTSVVSAAYTVTSNGSTAGVALISATAPSIASGFGTSPSIVNNGSASFAITIGSGGIASSGVVTMPAALTGWNCDVNDISAASGHAAYNTRQTASTTTSVTFENQTTSTGAAIAWGAGESVRAMCLAY